MVKTENLIYKCQTQRGEKQFQNIFQFQQKTDCESRWEEDGYGGKKWVEVGTITFVTKVLYLSTPTSSNTVFQSHLYHLYALVFQSL